MKGLLTFVLVLILAFAGCSSDGDGPAGDGGKKDAAAGNETGSGDVLLWPDKTVRKDSTPWKCSATSATACGGKKSMQCVSGTCQDCPEYYWNCDKVGDCECLGACDGAKCVGTSTACKPDDKNVCGGNTAMYCNVNVCAACPAGKKNCDMTKDCECSGTCAGKKCK